MTHALHLGDCLDVLRTLDADSVDSVVTDPPYELGFMGKSWDATGIAYNVELWRECMRVLKPGGHLLAFSGSRTYHRMTCAIEDAGFEIRDSIMWIYGSGFPKSLDVSKAIDKAAGAAREVVGVHPNPAGNKAGGNSLNMSAVGMPETAYITAPATDAARAWSGWGTALKPAHEPICVARKPLAGTVAANVLAHGTGALNIDGCRVAHVGAGGAWGTGTRPGGFGDVGADNGGSQPCGAFNALGRWPANVIHDGSPEVLAGFPITTSGGGNRRPNGARGGIMESGFKPMTADFEASTGSAARFFYCPKASKRDRDEGLDGFEAKQTTGGGGGVGDYLLDVDSASGKFGSEKAPARNFHPTVKPTDLMRYLVRLVTPNGGVVLDPFAGSGSTGKAAKLEGFRFIGIEREAAYVEIARARIAAA